MNNLEGLSQPLPHPHWLCEDGKQFFSVLLKSTMRKGKQFKNVWIKSKNRIYNLWNNHSFYMDGSVLPGNKTLTSTLVVLVRPPHPGIERHNHFHFVTRGVVILSNDDTIRACLNFAEWTWFVCCLEYWLTARFTEVSDEDVNRHFPNNMRTRKPRYLLATE